MVCVCVCAVTLYNGKLVSLIRKFYISWNRLSYFPSGELIIFTFMYSKLAFNVFVDNNLLITNKKLFFVVGCITRLFKSLKNCPSFFYVKIKYKSVDWVSLGSNRKENINFEQNCACKRIKAKYLSVTQRYFDVTLNVENDFSFFQDVCQIEDVSSFQIYF